MKISKRQNKRLHDKVYNFQALKTKIFLKKWFFLLNKEEMRNIFFFSHKNLVIINLASSTDDWLHYLQSAHLLSWPCRFLPTCIHLSHCHPLPCLSWFSPLKWCFILLKLWMWSRHFTIKVVVQYQSLLLWCFPTILLYSCKCHQSRMFYKKPRGYKKMTWHLLWPLPPPQHTQRGEMLACTDSSFL